MRAAMNLNHVTVIVCVVSLETLTAQAGERRRRAQYDRESRNEKLQELPIAHLKVTAPRSSWEINEHEGLLLKSGGAII